jgi:YidC/Oxa1 family membrane protein insertase
VGEERLHPVQALDSGLDKLGVPYSYGFAIILLTLLVKALTFPLSKKQASASRCL